MKGKGVSIQVCKRIQIKAYLKLGYGPSQVARILKVHRNTVSKWSKSKVIVDKKLSGRPSKCSPKTKQVMRRRMKEQIGASTRKTVSILNMSESYKIRHKKISKDTVRRHLKKTKCEEKTSMLFRDHDD